MFWYHAGKRSFPMVTEGKVHELLLMREVTSLRIGATPDREGGVWIGGRTTVLQYHRDGRKPTQLY